MSDGFLSKALSFDKRAIYSLTVMAAVLTLLAIYPLRSMTYAGLVPVSLLVAWLIYSFFAPVALMNRRAFLSQITNKRSRMRRVLWNSSFAHIRVALYSVLAAAVSLMAVSEFRSIHWVILFFSLPVLLLFIGALRDRMAGELNNNYEYWIVIRSSIALLLALLAIIVALYSFFLEEVPYYTNQSMIDAVSESFRSVRDGAATSEIGWLLGVNEAANTAVWYLMQTASQSADGGAFKILLWIAFLFLGALKIGSVLLVLGGALVLVDSFLRSGKRPLGETVFARSFSITIISLFAVYLLLTQFNIGRFLGELGDQVARGGGLQIEPCEDRHVLDERQFQAEADIALRQYEKESHTRMLDKIDQVVEQKFSDAEAGVDEFLDWNFSLKGQYEQLLYMAAGSVDNGLSDYVAKKINSYVMPASLEQSDPDDQLNVAFQAEVERLEKLNGNVMVKLAESMDCLTLPQSAFVDPDLISKSMVGAGAGSGAAAGTGVIAARGGIRIGSSAVGKAGVSRVIASLMAKFTAKLATSSVAVSGGVLCGPAALVCGPVLAVGAWLGTDLAINSADEALNRQAMKDDILMAISESKEELKEAYAEIYQGALAEVVDRMEEGRGRMFNPRRDGI